jgi:hypothetical protein
MERGIPSDLKEYLVSLTPARRQIEPRKQAVVQETGV